MSQIIDALKTFFKRIQTDRRTLLIAVVYLTLIADRQCVAKSSRAKIKCSQAILLDCYSG